ncbi:MAG: metallophosphoesterase family protein [Acidimicrobiia bacterium]|nr:metallophosphoesterase family protein [Acidimicrobiia bacterium]
MTHWLLRRPPAVEVFAVEDRTAQLVWRRAGPGPIEVRVAERVIVVETDGGPGSLLVDDLMPDTPYELVVRGPGLAVADYIHRFRTLAPPPGELLTSIGTISDLHLGADYFGYFATIRERPAPEIGAGLRCATAAVEAMNDWGADHVVFKGDVVHHGTTEQWEMAAQLLDNVAGSTDMMLGNHEVRSSRRVDPVEATAGLTEDFSRPVRVRDMPGVRLVVADTATPGRHAGRVTGIHDEVVDAVSTADGPAIVMLHHNLRHAPVPTFLPLGVPHRQSQRLLDTIATANPSTIVTSGHTHRNRRIDRNGIPAIEVGSPRDYPGVWCGYAVYEGGVRQVLRRVDRADCLAWTDRTRWAALGAWGRWSPGRMADRCFTHIW